MFVRFRPTHHRLQVSLVETRRIDGKVRHEHVASFGSIEVPPTVQDRLAFWARLHERLGRLANRLDADTQAKVLRAIHARVPMATITEQRALQLRNTEADEQFWTGIHDMHANAVQDYKGLARTVENAIAGGQAAAADAEAKATAARERVTRIEKGEDVVGSLGKPLTREDFEAALLASGFTKRDLRRLDMYGAVEEFGPEAFEVFKRSLAKSTDLLSLDVERKARAAIEYFSLCDDPVEAAKEMLAKMPPRAGWFSSETR